MRIKMRRIKVSSNIYLIPSILLLILNVAWTQEQQQQQDLHHQQSSLQQNFYKLHCADENQNVCLLSTTEKDNSIVTIRVSSIACYDFECKNSLVIAENGERFACKEDKKNDVTCKKRINLLQRLFENEYANNYDNKNVDDDDEFELGEKKRALPFETLNYGRRKRMLPFETLNYGKRAKYVRQYLNGYAKRMLPFETLNYGKRSQFPFEGFILGREINDEQ